MNGQHDHDDHYYTKAEIDGLLQGYAPIAPPPTEPPPTGVDISPGENIQSAVNANPDSTIFVLKPGVHGNQTFTPKPGQEFYGETGTILDGTGTTQYAVRGRDIPDVILAGLAVTGYDSGKSKGALAIGTGGGWTIRDCEVYENLSIGIEFSGNNNQILNNNVHHNQAMGIKGFGARSLVEDNEIAFNNYNDATQAGWEAGGTKFLKTDSLILRNNWVHDNHDNGLWCDYENVNTVYDNNVVENNLGNGIFHEVSYAAAITNNTIRGNGKRDIKIVSSSDVEVYGNTVVSSGGVGPIFGSDSERGSGNRGVFEVRNLWVHDNQITLDSGYVGVRDNRGTGKVWNNNNRFDRNTYMVNTDRPFFWKGNTKHTWAQWQAFGQDQNSTLTR